MQNYQLAHCDLLSYVCLCAPPLDVVIRVQPCIQEDPTADDDGTYMCVWQKEPSRGSQK